MRSFPIIPPLSLILQIVHTLTLSHNATEGGSPGEDRNLVGLTQMPGQSRQGNAAVRWGCEESLPLNSLWRTSGDGHKTSIYQFQKSLFDCGLYILMVSHLACVLLRAQ